MFVISWDILFNHLVLAVPKMGQMSESGTFSKCTLVLVSRFFAVLVYVKNKKNGIET